MLRKLLLGVRLGLLLALLLSASAPVAVVVVVVVVNRPVVVVVADKVLVAVRVDVVSGESDRDLGLARPEDARLPVCAASSVPTSSRLLLLTRGLAPPLMRTKGAWSLARGDWVVLMPRAPLPELLGDSTGLDALPVEEFTWLPGGDGESEKSADLGL